MWDSSAPPFVDQLRTELVACALWISEVNSAGQESAHVHYPKVNLSGTQGTADPLPVALLSQTNLGFSPYAEGAGGVPTGITLQLDLFLPATANGGTPRTAAYLESYAQTLLQQIFSRQPRIIPYNGPASFEEASDPSPGQWAADKPSHAAAYHHLRIRIPCGYNV